MVIDYPDMFDIMQIAKYHVENSTGDAIDERDDWVGCMENIGLTKKFQSRLMAPEATAMRSMGSAKEWTIEMITMRYEFLESLDDVIKTSSQGVDRPASRLTKSGNLATPNKAEPEVEGCRIFYKSGAMRWLESMFNTDGSLNFIEICSTPPTGFSSTIAGLYLTKEAEVAWEYAQMAARLVDGLVVPVGILEVTIPNQLLSSAYELVGEDWRSYVWGCRNKKGSPDDLSRVREFQWVVGPLCKSGQEKIKRMKDASELTLWRLRDGQVAHQIFTSNENMLKSLSEHCVGKVWLTSLAAKNKS